MDGSAFGADGRSFAATELASGGAKGATATGLATGLSATNGAGAAEATVTGTGEVTGSGFATGADGATGDVAWVVAAAAVA